MNELDKAQTPPAPDRAQEQQAADAAVLQESRKHTRRSFAVAALAAAAGFGFYEWIDGSRRLDMQPELLRKAFQTNAGLSRAVFNDRAMAPTYPLARAEELRVNGIVGLKQTLIPESWRLQLTGVANPRSYAQYVPDVTAWEYSYAPEQTKEDQGHDTKLPPGARKASAPLPQGPEIVRERAGKTVRGLEEAGKSASTLEAGTPGLLLTIDDIVKLPRHELVTQFKCIEGWSQIAHWGGVRMADLLAVYPPQKGPDGKLPRYVYMETPNGDYYVGYDLEICRHPQMLLVTELGGQPLTQFHGAPLRLHAPMKYGYKQIKRIGLIAYTNLKPDDYWTKLGYDWYAGL
jgi:hypothetical protein